MLVSTFQTENFKVKKNNWTPMLNTVKLIDFVNESIIVKDFIKRQKGFSVLQWILMLEKQHFDVILVSLSS